MKKITKQIVLFFATAGIGNLIYLGFYIYKKNKKTEQSINIQYSQLNDIDIAYNIFSTLGLGGKPLSQPEKRQVEFYTKDCCSRQDVLDIIIRMCGNPDTPKQRYLLAMAYAWSNKEYREKAIYYINLYLDNGLYNINNEYQRFTHLSQMYNELANKYEQTYQFEKALKCYKVSNDYHLKYLIESKKDSLDTSWNECLKINEASVLVKMNKIDEAISLLKDNKNNLKNKENIICINNKIKELQEKKKKGYIYKPRKK